MVLLITIGIVVIFSRLTAVIVVLTAPVDHHISRLINVFWTENASVDKLQRGYVFFTKGLLPSLLMSLVLQLISALVFT